MSTPWPASALPGGGWGSTRHKLALIHHGNYVGQYPEAGARWPRAVPALGLRGEARVLLLFGRLGRYKGGAELLEAFAALDDPGLWLVIAGKQVDPLTGARRAAGRRYAGASWCEDRFIPPEQVPRLFHAADMAVLPYRASLTSGTALLALSQARPVLAPAFPRLWPSCSPTATMRSSTRLRPADGLRSGPAPAAGLDAAGWPRCRRRPGQGRAVRLAPSGLLLDGIFARLLAALRPQRSLAAKLEGPAKEPAVGASVQAIRAAADAA